MKQYRVDILRIVLFLLLPGAFFGLISTAIVLIYRTQGNVKGDILSAFIFLAIPTIVIPLIIFANYLRHDHLTIIKEIDDSNYVQLTNKNCSIIIEKSRIRLIIERSYQSTRAWFYCKYWIIYYNNTKYIISSLPISDVKMYELFGDQKFKRICKFIPLI